MDENYSGKEALQGFLYLAAQFAVVGAVLGGIKLVIG